MKLLNSMFYLGSVWRMTSVIFVVCVVASLLVETQTQQFYPNGRYGRRDSMPPLNVVGREMTVAFFGDGSVRCDHTGYEDYYRCSRKLDNRGISTPDD